MNSIVTAISNVKKEAEEKSGCIVRQKSVISKNKLYCGAELAQLREKEEVYFIILNGIKERLTEENEEEEE